MKSNIIKKMGWKELVPDAKILSVKPEGYNTCEEIAEELGVSLTGARNKMKKLREAGAVECVKVHSGAGPGWAYKR